MKKAARMVLSMALGGCAAMKPTYQTESSFVIYDVRPAGIDRTQLLDAVQAAVQKSASKARVMRDIPPATLPETPGRFELKDSFANSNLGALMAAQGQAMRVPTCQNALMTIASDDTSMAGYGEKTTFFLCLLPYREGYHIDIYATFTRASGGFSPEALTSATVRSMTGDSSQIIPRTMMDIRKAAESIGGQVTVVDRYIPESFKGLFVDQTAAAGR